MSLHIDGCGGKTHQRHDIMTTDLEMKKREHGNEMANVQRFGSGIHASVDCLLFGFERILERVVPTEVSTGVGFFS